MPSIATDHLDKVTVVADFISAEVIKHRSHFPPTQAVISAPPLFVGVQGPQGAGKSFLSALVPERLASAEYGGLRTVALSLDDLYLTHQDQVALAGQNPGNGLLKGRGPPGTHDLTVAKMVLQGLRGINVKGAGRVKTPAYDKSLFGGEGDRKEAWNEWEGRIDVVIFEGWMTGFWPLDLSQLRQRYNDAKMASSGVDVAKDTHPLMLQRRQEPFFLDHPLEDLEVLNLALRDYIELWNLLDAFIELRPTEPGSIWSWRLEQEHHMKRLNGGKGMSDEQVGAFIARYAPIKLLLMP